MRIELLESGGVAISTRDAATLYHKGMPRARRYKMETMVRYRTRGTRDWQEGELENISTTGLLFRTGQPLYLDTTIEMQFSLPIELSGENAAEVFCRGSVVRSTESEMRGGAVHIAVRIENSRFLRPAG